MACLDNELEYTVAERVMLFLGMHELFLVLLNHLYLKNHNKVQHLETILIEVINLIKQMKNILYLMIIAQ